MTALPLAAAVVALLAPAAHAQGSATQKLCVTVFRGANETSNRGTTLYNRQASVQAVSCNGFGFDTHFHVDGGIVCALTSAAIGPKFPKLSLYIDGSCSGASLAANHDVGTVSGQACGMLSDLLGAFPPAKAYAVAAGVACSFGGPVGSWIESKSERVAAEGVIRGGKCLSFSVHSFPRTDQWSAVACRPDDRGFSNLPRGGSLPVAPPPPPSPPPPPAAPQTRATMSWDSDADIDLYAWDEAGNEALWINRIGIPSAELVEDVIPREFEFEHASEVFRETGSFNRRYSFGICEYRGEWTDVNVTVIDPGGAARTLEWTLIEPGDSAILTTSPVGGGYTPPSGWCLNDEGR
jgi:hypothetical protein